MSHDTPSRKRASRLSTPVRTCVAAVAACFIAAPVLSNPVNPTVVNGAATFNQAGNVLTVTNSNGTIINWDKFSIKAGETTHFAQTSASSTVMNRVLLSEPSSIYGTLSSNGRVWLINPAGIMVGPGGRVDTAAFVASTLGTSNQDFLAGRKLFVNDGTAKDVVNQGEITTPNGGSVYLIGANVSNESVAGVANSGIITTPNGETILAAGSTVSLIDSALPGVKVDITGAAGNSTNLGTITAEAGRIGIAGVIVRNSGLLNASSVVNEGGRIFLRASKDAYVDGNGRIVTTGTRGGSVEVLGERVAVMDNASIDASGTGNANAGGGQILVGGDYQGKNPDIQNANTTYVGPNTTLKADASGVGDGGKVIVWADDTTQAYGNISARRGGNGGNGGNGGFVETSGKQHLKVNGIRVDTGGGTWLLDPMDFTIATTGGDIDGATLATNLGLGDVIIQSSDGGTAGPGDIFVNDTVSWAGANSLKLLAGRNVAVNQNIDATSGGNLWLVAGWDTASTANPATTAGTGNINVATGKTAHGSSVYARAGNDITSTGTGNYTGYVYLKAGGDINVKLDGDFTAETITSGKSITIADPGALVTLTQGITTNDGNVSLSAGGVISSITGDIDLGSGVLTLNSGGANTYRVATGKRISAGGVVLADANTDLAGLTDLVVKTDLLTMAAGSELTSAGVMSIQPKSSNRSMRIGGTNPGGVLYLNGLSQLSPGTLLELGSDDGAYTGTTTVAGSFSLPVDVVIRAGLPGGSTADIKFDASGGNILITNGSGASRDLALFAGHDILFSGGTTTFQTTAANSPLKVLASHSGSAFGVAKVESGATLTLDGFNSSSTVVATIGPNNGSDGGVWENYGTINLNGYSLVDLTTPGGFHSEFNNRAGGVLTINSAEQWSFLSDGAQADPIHNYGTITANGANGGNYTAWEAKYSQYGGGVLNIGAGKILSMQNADVISGAVNIDADGSLLLSETHDGLRSFSGTTITGPGWVDTVNGGTTFSGVTLANATLVNSTGALAVPAGITTYSGNVGFLANGVLTTPAAAISTSGSITLGSGWDGVSPVTDPVFTAAAANLALTKSLVAGGNLNLYASGNITFASDTHSGSHVITHSYTDSDGVSRSFYNTYSSDYSAGGNINVLAGGAISLGTGVSLGSLGNGSTQLYAGWDKLDVAAPILAAPQGTQDISISGASLFSKGSGAVTLAAGDTIWIDASTGYAGIDMHTGDLGIDAKWLLLTAGNGVGQRNMAKIASNGDQYFTLGALGLQLKGSDGDNTTRGGAAVIERFGGSDGQSFTLTGGGQVKVLAGYGGGDLGVGSFGGFCDLGGCSSNFASIKDYGAGGQTFDFVNGGTLTVTAATNAITIGNNNFANIHSAGAQTITSRTLQAITINITGGIGGAVSGTKYLSNDAGIGSDVSQTINTYGGTVTMIGGGDATSLGGAYLGAPVQNLTFGNLIMTGGASDAAGEDGFSSPVFIGNENGADITLDLTGAILSTLTGGTGTTSPVGIGSLTGTASVVITSAYDLAIGSSSGGVGIGSISAVAGAAAGGVYIANGSSIVATTDTHSRIQIAANNDVAIGGTLESTGTGVTATDGVFITAGKAILDQNSSALNITAGNIALTSTAGHATGLELAISMDTAATKRLDATVVGGAHGGIAIVNDGAQPTLRTVLTDSASDSFVGFYNSGSLALTANNIFTATTGTIRVKSDGDLTGIASLNFAGAPTKIELKALGGNMNLAAALVSAGNIDLSASGTLTIGQVLNGQNLTLQGSTINLNAATTASADLLLVGSTVNVTGVTAQAQNVAVGAGTLNLTAGGWLKATTGDLGIVAGDIYASNGKMSAAVDLAAIVAGDISLTSGSSMVGNNDVYLVLGGADSTLSMNSSSYVLAGSPATIHLGFLSRSSGGVMIDGVATTTSLPGQSGFFVVNTSTPAKAGAGLNLVYSIANIVDPVLTNALNNAVDDAATDKTPTDNTVPVIDTTKTDPNKPAGDPTKTAGGTEGGFGGEDGNGDGKGGKDGKDGKDPKDKDEQNQTKDEKKDDKPAAKKVAQCS